LKQHPAEYARATAEWLEWYAAHHIERVAFGMLTLRRRTSSNNWRCSVEVTTSSNEALGPHVLHLFESQDYLANIRRQEDLLHLRLRPHFITLESLRGGQFAARDPGNAHPARHQRADGQKPLAPGRNDASADRHPARSIPIVR
jgi:hypothetical protein